MAIHSSIPEEHDPIQCDLLLIVATSTEEDELKRASKRLALPFKAKKNSLITKYYEIGQVGDFRVNAIRTGLGPLGYQGSASRGILCQRATGATSIIQLGMAFGVDKSRQNIGDVLVSTSLLPYDDREIFDDPNQPLGYKTDYKHVVEHPSKLSLLNLFRNPARRGETEHGVHVGALLSGAARISSDRYLAELLTQVPCTGEEIVGGEMEGVGLLSISPRTDPLWLVIKGISDFATTDRHEHIRETRKLACRNAAFFVLNGLLTDSRIDHPTGA